MLVDDRLIAAAVEIDSPGPRNRAITSAYAVLARALESVLGDRDANWLHFGAWASASAGTVIRGDRMTPKNVRAAVLKGNTAIIGDIGPRFARFLALHSGSAGVPELRSRVADDPLLTESQELADAFDCYARLASPASDELDDRTRAQLTLRANVQVAHHEQAYADPIIDEAIPGGSLLGALSSTGVTFRIPDGTLRVTRDVPRPRYLDGAQWPAVLDALDDPGLVALAAGFRQDESSTRHSDAPDWQDLDERMGFIFCLFRSYQRDAAIRQSPLAED